MIDKDSKTKFLTACESLLEGQLSVRIPDGNTLHFGTNGPQAELKIRDWTAISVIAARGQVGIGESYVQGMWDTPSIEGLMTLLARNRNHFTAFDQASALNRIKFRLVDRLLRANSRRGSKRNIRSHYDVGNEFYLLWLDEGMTYSSGLFGKGETDLGLAQRRKNARILSRLGGGERLLEIGCGWGGFVEQAADEGRDVTAITISRNQHSFAESRLDGRARICLRDYRDITGQYDNIVSIEMVEAIGERYWPSYFATLKRSLAKGGRAMLQVITIRDDLFDNYRTSSDYIRQYVFPGGMVLSDRAIAIQARATGLRIVDHFAFGQSYARTCRMWAERLTAKKRQIAELGHGEAFFRNWHYYLELCAASFAVGQTNVAQVELVHADSGDAV